MSTFLAPGHGDPIAGLLLSLAVILIAAKIGGHLAVRFGQPSIVGELVGGLVLGNLTVIGFSDFDRIKMDPGIDMLARLGVLLLLFQVGVESTVGQMRKVGLSSLLVATLGVAGPFALGWGVGAWLVPGASLNAHLFLAATLTATSVGITARVLKDLDRSASSEARVILGAAIIDDVEGLIILAAVTGMAASTAEGDASSYTTVALLLVKAAVFLFGSLFLGVTLAPHVFSVAARLQGGGVLLALGLTLCFFFAWLADLIGLAPIVGAFAAGLVLEDVHYGKFVGRGEPALNELIEPLTSFLVPVFFVVMGLRIDLRAFEHASVLGLAAALTTAAIAGKLLCALGVVGRGLDRLSVAIGMIPRGEVGLIFANLGLTVTVAGEPLVDRDTFSAIVVMVIVTTMITPPALKWSFGRFSRRLVAAN